MLTSVLLVILATQSQAAPPPRDVPADARSVSGTCAISGRVTDKESGRPLHRAIVTLAPQGSAQPHMALADEEGRYEFIGLAPGEYGISAGPPELRATHLHQAFGQSGPMQRPWDRPRKGVALKPGEIRTSVDLSLMRTLAIEGRVLDSSDEPMAEVGVHLLRADGSPFPVSAPSTDDRGHYRLFGLPPGRYHVCAAPQSSREPASDGDRFVRTCHPSSLAETDAADVVLSKDDALGIDIRVQRAGAYSVSGTVIDSAGAIVEAPHVLAAPLDRRNQSVSSGQGQNGRFLLRGLLPGRYVVRASIGGPVNPSDTRPPARELETGFVIVDIAGADADVAIRLSTAETIPGRVVFDGPAAPNPKGMRMVVYASPLLSPYMVERPPFAAVSDDLTFELAKVYRQQFVIHVKGLPDGWAVKSIVYRGTNIHGIPTELADGSKPDVLQILATNRVARPKVRLISQQGTPGTSWRLVLFPVDPARWKAPSVLPSDQQPADDVLSLGAILPGEYFVAALTQDDVNALFNDVSRLEQLAQVATKVTFTEGDDRTVDVQIRPLPAMRR
jgi:Carboxypeptidase regulatory-like domain